jgi:hypothetical protein
MVLRRPAATATEEEVRAYHRRVASALEELGVANGAEFHLSAPAGLDARRLGPFARESETSRAAAIRAYPQQGSHRRRILFAIARAPEGLTRDEIEDRVKLGGNTVRPRVRELIEDGYIEETETVRPTRLGSEAAVLALTGFGHSAIGAHGDGGVIGRG